MYKQHKFHEWMYQSILRMDYPPIVCFSIPKVKYVFVNDPKLIKFTLEDNFESVQKGAQICEAYEPLLGHGIFVSNGETWKFHRKVASRMFSIRNLKDFMFSIAKRNTITTIEKLKELSVEPEIDINDILGRFTLDTFCEIAFGVNIDSVKTYPETHEFGIAFDDLVKRVDKRTTDAFWKIKRLIGAENETMIAKDNKIIVDFVLS